MKQDQGIIDRLENRADNLAIHIVGNGHRVRKNIRNTKMSARAEHKKQNEAIVDKVLCLVPHKIRRITAREQIQTQNLTPNPHRAR